jgi:hypothetical protein
VGLPPSDSAQIGASIPYDDQRYKAGSNIVVVWPRMNNLPGVAADSAFFQVCFDSLLSLITPFPPPKGPLLLLPNPAGDRLWIETGRPDQLESVRIFDIEGRLCAWRHGAGEIDLSRFMEGLYIVEVRWRGGEIHRRKLLKL